MYNFQLVKLNIAVIIIDISFSLKIFGSIMKKKQYIEDDFMEFIALASLSFVMILGLLYIAY